MLLDKHIGFLGRLVYLRTFRQPSRSVIFKPLSSLHTNQAFPGWLIPYPFFGTPSFIVRTCCIEK